MTSHVPFQSSIQPVCNSGIYGKSEDNFSADLETFHKFLNPCLHHYKSVSVCNTEQTFEHICFFDLIKKSAEKKKEGVWTRTATSPPPHLLKALSTPQGCP